MTAVLLKQFALFSVTVWFLVQNAQCESQVLISSTESPPPQQATSSNAFPVIPTSSSSSEDQLTPLLINSSPSYVSTCVNCLPTLCTLSKVSYLKTTIHYNWRVDGLPEYIAYLEKFQTPFEMSNDVRFNATPPNDGDWTFSFSRQDHTPLELRVTYRLMSATRSSPKLAFDLGLTTILEDESVTLPSQISSQATLTGLGPHSSRAERSRPIRNNMSYSWAYVFIWSDIQSKLMTLIETAGLLESQTSVEFKFTISSYQEKTPSTNALENCQNWNDGQRPGSVSHHTHRHHHHGQHFQHANGGTFELHPVHNFTWPPFLHNMYTIMKDDKYTDLTIKSGDDEFQIHRVIAAYSSPVLATMIFNRTYDKSESLIDFGEDIGSDVVEELIRYMYTGKVEDIEEIADRLLVAATTYGFPLLKKQCESALIKQVKTDNAFSMYALGAEVGSMRLKRRAFNVMKENKSKIVAQSEEFRKLSVHHPDVMYELFLS